MKKARPTVLTRVIAVAVIGATAAWSAASAQVATLEWPLEIDVPTAKIVIYQPQLESFEGNKLTARAAVAVTKADTAEPVFGAVWFAARVETDRDARTVTCLQVDVTDAKFPEANPEDVHKLSAELKGRLSEMQLTLSLDRLLTMLELVEQEQQTAEDLETTPPRIIVVDYPAVLVTIDGEPKLGVIPDTNLMRVVNTPFFIVFDRELKNYYLQSGGYWLSAPDAMGPWQAAEHVPDEIQTLASKNVRSVPPSSGSESHAARMPRIIVATEPTELIQTDGAAVFGTVRGTDLLYVSNTKSDVFMDIQTQDIYVLLSGRWFTSQSKDGPWTYVPPDTLPADFARIPPGSDKGHVLSFVAGTPEAKDAVLETYIPQTTQIDRSAATVSVTYDGEPKFEKIEGTTMYYAVNTPYSVIRVDGVYYCCHDAVWYQSASPTSSWVVSVSVPKVIYTIPPSCPVYNVKYVYLYDHTPSVVYVGYTPGYVGCYVHGSTVVYGTGHHYHAWHGSVYCARPATWGFSVAYNSHTGNWAFRAGYAGPGGWLGVGGVHIDDVDIHGWGRGWWGPGGHRHASVNRFSRNVNINNNININRNNIYARRDITRSRTKLEGRGETPVAQGKRRDGTRSKKDRQKTVRSGGHRAEGTSTRGKGRRRADNIFADKEGNVYRKSLDGWRQRKGKSWSKPAWRAGKSGEQQSVKEKAQRSGDRRKLRGTDQGGGRKLRQDLDRHHRARQRGASRSLGSQRSRGSATHGGGRRRR
ncbi:MAG: hypothetical protein JSU63_13390 [Phycisphaerales bacterium]|nr:MAG: hypothetical protein JSU63_13390 [Phycisphaerales bacterium]